MARKTEPETPLRLPIKLHPVSNGEYIPRPTPPLVREAARRAAAATDASARAAGMTRRDWLRSACGAAATLLALDQTLGCGGGRYAVPPAAATDPAAANAAVGGRELIFDVQTHHVTPERDWFQRYRVLDFLKYMKPNCGDAFLRCFGRDPFVKEIFLDSDTDIAVLSALAGDERENPLHIDEAAATRDAVDALGREGRLLLHGIVQPNVGPLTAALESMHALVERWKVAAFKLYTVWGPGGKGYFLDDPKLGIPVLETARKLGVKRIAVHKGIPLPGTEPTYTRCRDIGVVAKRFPDLSFLVYHSGYEHAFAEGPYGRGEIGVDGLIRSLEENGIGKGGNVWAELGATWQSLMTKPDQAAHVLGKLVKHLGEDRVLWGTDCIWFGSPQDQIQAFRAFTIAPEWQDKHGYPALTPERKAKILGLNAAAVYGVDPAAIRARRRADAVGRAKEEYVARGATPTFATYGPTV